MAVHRHGGVAEVRGVVAACMPGYRIDTVVPVGDGLDNLAYEVNGKLIVRFRKEPDPKQLDREAGLLAAIAAVAPLPVPAPTFTVAEQGCLAYLKLPGTPLLDLPRLGRSEHATSIAATLGDFLTALHAVPAGRMTDLVDIDDQALAEWRREAAATYPTVARHIPAAHRRAVEAFLDAPPPDDGHALVFSHNDLGIEHILIDPGTWTVTGIIDWSDAGLVDPAHDFGMLYRDLGPTALRAAVSSYRTDTHDLAALSERAVFYARCGVLEDMAYGIATERGHYLDKSLDAMEWLFPA
ncbi:aminoglycoside phosphotransferase family protein [Actinoplanes sp. NPDC051475]|uniref:phosphotransferase family protein n=1 Tax=Actinoplanes sp. NPDC051475 TaxID=3157225 RepID=UPI00344E75AC